MLTRSAHRPAHRPARWTGRRPRPRGALISGPAALLALVGLLAVLLPTTSAPSASSRAGGGGGEGPRPLQLQLASRADPQPTTLLSVVPGDGSVTLTWAQAPDNDHFGATGIWVDGEWDHDVDVRDGTTSDTFSNLYDGTPLANGVEHEFAVTVVTWTKDNGFKEWHESALSNRIRDAAGDFPPAQPATPTASAAEAATTVTWARSTEPDMGQYLVLRTGGGATDALVGQVPQPSSGAVSFVDRTGAKGQAYTYSVKALDARGHASTASRSSGSVTAQNLVFPGAPTGLSAAPRDQTIALSWNLGTEQDLKEYRVTRDGAAVGVVTAPGHAFTDTGLVNGRQYSYAVTAADYGGNTSLTAATVRAAPYDDSPPGTPTGLSATAGDGEVSLTWTANAESDLAGYDLFRDGVRAAGAVLGAGVTSYTDTGLSADRTYSYALRARDTNGNPSPTSASATATPFDHTPPAVPARPTATPGEGSVVRSWTANREADLASYQVLRGGTVVATLARRTTAYTDTSLTGGTAYQYAIAAVDTHGNTSAPSAPPVSATPLDTTPPAVPSGLTAARGDARVVLSWSASTDRDLASYRVLRGGVVVVAAVGAPATAFTDTGLTNDTTHQYSLSAVDTTGNASTASAAVSATPTDLTAPAAPAGVTYTPGDTVVDIAWRASPETDLAAYRVFRDGRLIATVAVVAPPGTTPTSYRDSGLVNGVQHAYAVAAVDTHGNESVRAGDAATPVDTTPPDTPTGLTTTPGDHRVVLTWTASTASDVASYRVLRDGTEVAVVAAPALTHTDTGLANGRGYSYALAAVDGSGNRSATSAARTGTPGDSTPPAAPTAVSATARDGTATVRWTAPADTDVAAYQVVRADGTVAATVLAPASSAVLAGLANGSSVTFTVVAVDSSGNSSAASATVSVTPASTTPVVVVPAQGAGQKGALTASPDGRWLVVDTSAPLDPSDTNGLTELYEVDTTGRTPPRRIAPLRAGATVADSTNTSDVAVSADGRHVVLATTAALSPRDANTLLDVYRGDLSTTPTTWTLVSVPASGATSRTVAGTLLQTGTVVHATSPSVAVSADGSRVLFYSARDDLVSGDGNGAVDVFAKDLVGADAELGPVTRVSTAAGGGSSSPVITATGPALALTPDGRYAVFTATAQGVPQAVYRKDLGTTAGSPSSAAGTLVVASSTPPVASTSGNQWTVSAYRDTGDVAVSDDGRYVAFVSAAKLATTTPTALASTGLAYRKDLTTGAVTALGTGQTTTWEHQVGLSPDGTFATFSTTAALVPSDTNGHTDVYGRDLSTGSALVLVTSTTTGAPVTSPNAPVSPAEYGRTKVLTTTTVLVVTVQPLVPSDTNSTRDVYRKDLASGAVVPVAVG